MESLLVLLCALASCCAAAAACSDCLEMLGRKTAQGPDRGQEASFGSDTSDTGTSSFPSLKPYQHDQFADSSVAAITVNSEAISPLTLDEAATNMQARRRGNKGRGSPLQRALIPRLSDIFDPIPAGLPRDVDQFDTAFAFGRAFTFRKLSLEVRKAIFDNIKKKAEDEEAQYHRTAEKRQEGEGEGEGEGQGERERERETQRERGERVLALHLEDVIRQNIETLRIAALRRYRYFDTMAQDNDRYNYDGIVVNHWDDPEYAHMTEDPEPPRAAADNEFLEVLEKGVAQKRATTKVQAWFRGIEARRREKKRAEEIRSWKERLQKGDFG